MMLGFFHYELMKSFVTPPAESVSRNRKVGRLRVLDLKQTKTGDDIWINCEGTRPQESGTISWKMDNVLETDWY